MRFFAPVNAAEPPLEPPIIARPSGSDVSLMPHCSSTNTASSLSTELRGHQLLVSAAKRPAERKHTVTSHEGVVSGATARWHLT